MQFTPTLLAFLTTSSLAQAGCFTSGSESWGSGAIIARAKENAKRTCHGNLGGRDFKAGEERTECFNIADDKRVNFRMTYMQNDPVRHMGYADCVRHLTGLIDGCERGGNGDDGKWSYKSDPNGGRC